MYRLANLIMLLFFAVSTARAQPETLYEQDETTKIDPYLMRYPRHAISLNIGIVGIGGNHYNSDLSNIGLGLDMTASVRLHKYLCLSATAKGVSDAFGQWLNDRLVRGTDEQLPGDYLRATVYGQQTKIPQNLYLGLGGGLSFAERALAVDIYVQGGSLYTPSTDYDLTGYYGVTAGETPFTARINSGATWSLAFSGALAVRYTLLKRWGLGLKADYMSSTLHTENHYKINSSNLAIESTHSDTSTIQWWGIGIQLLYYWGREAGILRQ